MASLNSTSSLRVSEARLHGASLTLPLILAIFFLSGFSGLVYQVVWVKLLTHVFGVTTTLTLAGQ